MDTLSAIRSFVRVVETGSFSAVAKEENTNQATVSKRVAALESELGAILLMRGSRTHTLTEVGQSYYERVRHILRDLDEAEGEARLLTGKPQGRLRVTVPTMFGSLYVAPIIAEFLTVYPDIQLDMKFSEEMVDLVKEGVDIAIRLGELKDSSLIARRLGTDNLIVVATPEYLAKHSEPVHPHALSQHNCLAYSLASTGAVWGFTHPKPDTSVHVTGNFQCDTGSGLMELLLAHVGIAFMPTWLVAPYIETGQLVHILKDYYRMYPISAVYPRNRYIPLKVKCFVDYIEKRMCTESKTAVEKVN